MQSDKNVRNSLQEPAAKVQEPLPGSLRTEGASSPAPARRKTIDRRDAEAASPLKAEDRRTANDRRNASEQAKIDKQKALEKIREQNQIRIQQHRKKKLLAGCEPVMGLNYDSLALDDYPDNETVAKARRDRDYWIVCCSVLACVFLAGLVKLVPAWVAASACGLAIVSFLFAFSPIRSSFFSRPPLSELLYQRKMLEFRALSHIFFLEGKDGLAWRCEKLAKYNNNLDRKLFKGLIRFSKEKDIRGVIKEKKHIRLYLLFMIEAQKAYKRLQNDYLSNHFKHLDQGWDDTVNDAEALKLEQQSDSNKAATS